MRRKTAERFTVALAQAQKLGLKLEESGQPRGEKRWYALVWPDGTAYESPRLNAIELRLFNIFKAREAHEAAGWKNVPELQDMFMNLIEARACLDKLIEEYGAEALIRTNGGHNNVGIEVKRRT